MFNVLLGDMSLIGPRPILATQSYETLSDLAKERLKIRPGITGYAQAYYRNAIGEEEKFKIDCYYGKHISFGLDVKIFDQNNHHSHKKKIIFMLVAIRGEKEII